MAKDVGVNSRVVELGAGTGTVTQALLANGVAPGNLYLVGIPVWMQKIGIAAGAFLAWMLGYPVYHKYDEAVRARTQLHNAQQTAWVD